MNVQFETGKDGRTKDEWLTPKYILDQLGHFDLDPCAPIVRPWDTADRHYTVQDDGLSKKWEGRVWCNPPYGKQLGKWLERCAEHGNCMVLTFARVETQAFFDHVWSDANAIFFFKRRLQFCHVDGTCVNVNAGAPSCLIAYGWRNALVLETTILGGKYIPLCQ